MSRTVRAIVAAASLVAFAAIPLVADWCAISCEAAHANATTEAPACHHADSSAPRVGHAPAPCGQGHRPIVVDAAATTVAAARTVVSCLPALRPEGAPTDGRQLRPAGRASPDLDRSAAYLPLALSSTLRI